MIRKSYKFRLFTNANQERELAVMLETHRRLYNTALDGRRLCWETARADWSYYDQVKWLSVKRESNPWLGKLNCHSARLTLKRLDLAYQRFFKGGGLPRFKPVGRFSTFAFESDNGWKLSAGKLRITGVGLIRVRWHRQIHSDAKIKQCTITNDNGKWFVVFSVVEPSQKPLGNAACVGVDVGLKAFVTTSDGEQLGRSDTLESNLKGLRRLQRSLSRCKKGSSRRQKVKKRVAALYAKIRNSRKDMQHKVARSLVNRFGFIAVERLNIKGMLKNGRLARRIADAAWGSFITILSNKAESAGAKVILVDPRNTSQRCSRCSELVPKSLAVRVHRCECGLVLDRDVNAARNILAGARPQIAKLEVVLA